MSRENTSSVDMANGKKMAYLSSQEKVAIKREFQAKDAGVEPDKKQVINSKKLANLSNAKAKAKKRAKLVKASKKRNKK